MMSLASAVWNNGRRVASIPRRLITLPLARKAFASCGSPFYMGKGCDFQGIENIHVGNNVSFGPRTLIWTTRAQVYIGNDVMFGPDCSIVSGDHRTDIKGKPMMAVTEDEKRPEDDQDVVIEDDCWLGGVHRAQGRHGCDRMRHRLWGRGHEEHGTLWDLRGRARQAHRETLQERR